MNQSLIVLICGVAWLAMHQELAAATIDPLRAKSDNDGKTLWYDGQDIGVKGKGWPQTSAPYSRFPVQAQALVSPGDWGTSHLSTGLQLRFSTESNLIQVRWHLTNTTLAMPHMPATGVSGVDLYAKDNAGRWQFSGNGRPTGLQNSAAFGGSPSHEFLLYLPLYNGVASIEVGIPKNFSLVVPDAPVKPVKQIVWYGHSISQGACASRPGMASTNMVGRRLDCEIINLGFSGSGVMDAQVSAVIAQLDPAVFVLDCMANMRPEDIPARVQPFIKTLRVTHPNTPILLVEEYHVTNIQMHRGTLLRKEFDQLTASGDRHLHWMTGKDMLGTDGDGTVDGVHPNDLGMARQADAFVASLSAILKAGN